MTDNNAPKLTADEKEHQAFREAVLEMFRASRRDSPPPWGADLKFPEAER